MARPRVHVTGDVPAAIDAAIAESFDPVERAERRRRDPGADHLADRRRVPRACRPAAADRRELRRRCRQHRPRGRARRGIVVANTPDVLTETTAELAIALTLSLLRRVTEGDRMLRAGRTWGFALEFMLGEGLAREALRRRRAGPHRPRNGAARRGVRRDAGPRRARRARPGAPRGADIVSLHCPLTPETRHLIDARALALVAADRRPREHGARGDRRRARARRGASGRAARRRCARRVRARAGGDGGAALVRERRPDAAPRQRDRDDARGDGPFGGRCTPCRCCSTDCSLRTPSR